MRIFALLMIGVLWSTAMAKEEFHQVNFSPEETAALYQLKDHVVQACKFEWCFDQPTATALVTEMKKVGEKDWTVVSRTKESPKRKVIATVLLDPRPTSQTMPGKILLRCGWGFEDRTGAGLGGGWGSRDVVLPGVLGTGFEWDASRDKPEEMFLLTTATAVYRVRLEKTGR